MGTGEGLGGVTPPPRPLNCGVINCTHQSSRMSAPRTWRRGTGAQKARLCRRPRWCCRDRGAPRPVTPSCGPHLAKSLPRLPRASGETETGDDLVVAGCRDLGQGDRTAAQFVLSAQRTHMAVTESRGGRRTGEAGQASMTSNSRAPRRPVRWARRSPARRVRRELWSLRRRPG